MQIYSLEILVYVLRAKICYFLIQEKCYENLDGEVARTECSCQAQLAYFTMASKRDSVLLRGEQHFSIK